MEFRLNQYIARSSNYSRREADRLILDGVVEVNGVLVTNHATRVCEIDEVKVHGKVLFSSKPDMYLFYKPVECLVSKHDPEGRRTIYDILPPKLHYLHAVGRLDYMSEGLLLLTNDGNFARHLTLPKNGVGRVYEVKVFTRHNNIERAISDLAKGIKIQVDGQWVNYRPIKVEIVKQGANNWTLKWCFSEGKNREIRNICKHYGWQISRLKRVSYGDYKLDEMKPGEWKVFAAA